MLELIKQPEGRRLEFKETMPSKSDIAKIAIAFANDLENYPEIQWQWKEIGKSFRVVFTKRMGTIKQELKRESLETKILQLLKTNPLSRKQISVLLGQKAISGQLNEVLKRLFENNWIELTIKEKPKLVSITLFSFFGPFFFINCEVAL